MNKPEPSVEHIPLESFFTTFGTSNSLHCDSPKSNGDGGTRTHKTFYHLTPLAGVLLIQPDRLLKAPYEIRTRAQTLEGSHAAVTPRARCYFLFLLRSTEQGYSLPLLIRQISMPDSSSLSSLASKYPLLSRISRLRYASRYPSHRAGRCLPHP